MSKKIIVFNGSPRTGGNTVKLVNAFVKGAEEAGNEISVFDLQKLEIKPCLGCLRGGKDINSPCVQKDDMGKIYPEYADADIMVWASPLYYWNISGKLKCLIDRLFAVAEANKYKNPNKECVLLMTADGDAFEDTVTWYEKLGSRSTGWKSIGKVLCGNLHGSDDMEGREEVGQAYDLGRSIG